MNEMQDGQRVEVRLAGIDDEWFAGTVVRARKMWVQLDTPPFASALLADESNIVDWRPIDAP